MAAHPDTAWLKAIQECLQIAERLSEPAIAQVHAMNAMRWRAMGKVPAARRRLTQRVEIWRRLHEQAYAADEDDDADDITPVSASSEDWSSLHDALRQARKETFHAIYWFASERNIETEFGVFLSAILMQSVDGRLIMRVPTFKIRETEPELMKKAFVLDDASYAELMSYVADVEWVHAVRSELKDDKPRQAAQPAPPEETAPS